MPTSKPRTASKPRGRSRSPIVAEFDDGEGAKFGRHVEARWMQKVAAAGGHVPEPLITSEPVLRRVPSSNASDKSRRPMNSFSSFSSSNKEENEFITPEPLIASEPVLRRVPSSKTFNASDKSRRPTVANKEENELFTCN